MKTLARQASLQAQILFWFVALLWVLELVDTLVLHGSLDRFGIQPRDPNGLVGVLFAPLLHAGFAHLLANTVPLVVLGWLVMIRRLSDFFAVTIVVWLLGGLGVWLFAAPHTVHIGASGLIFGYLGFLLLRGYFERSFGSIFLSIVVGLLYGSAIWGILPSRPGVSWQGHLFGFLAGILTAWLLAAPRSRRAALSSRTR